MNKYDSKEVIRETFALYKEAGENDDIPSTMKDGCIIHIYPTRDTIVDGELEGYYQNMFFKMFVFDLDTMTVYKPEREFDAIFTHGCMVESLSVFKDGAFCIKVKGVAKFLPGQACSFWTDSK